MRYKIEITLFNYTKHPKGRDLVIEYFYRFDNKKDTTIAMLQDAIEEVNTHNCPYDDEGIYGAKPYHFVDLCNDKYDAIVCIWDGTPFGDRINVKGYKIIQIEEEQQ